MATAGPFGEVVLAEVGWADLDDFRFLLPPFLSPIVDLPRLSLRSLSLILTR